MKKIVWFVMAVAVISLRAQEFRLDFSADFKSGPGYFDRWDSSQDKLIFYRDVNIATSPGIRTVQKNGDILAIYPLKDFPDAQRMTIWSVAGTTDGGVVASAIAEFGPREMKHVPARALLLTYDASGRLTKAWDTQPYQHTLVTVNDANEVFALGGKDSVDKNFPLLIKYSPDGKVIGGYLPARIFPVGDAVVQQGSPNGESQMFILHKQLHLWLAPVQELFTLSMTGEILKRVSLAVSLDHIATSIGAKRVKVDRLSVMEDGRVACQVIALSSVKGERPRFGFVTISADGTEPKLLDAVSERPSPGRLIGNTSTGRLVFLEAVGDGIATYKVH